MILIFIITKRGEEREMKGDLIHGGDRIDRYGVSIDTKVGGTGGREIVACRAVPRQYP